MRFTMLVIPMLLATTCANASSDDAWAELNRAVAEKCTAASMLKRAHASEIVKFDDSLGKVVTVVSGIFSQKALKGAQGTMLCVYDKQTKKVWIDEAKGWSAPDMR